MIDERVSSSAAWSEIDNVIPRSSFDNSSILSTSPQVETEMCLEPIFSPSGSPTRRRNFTVLS